MPAEERTIIHNCSIVTPDAVIDTGWLDISGGQITAVHDGPFHAPGISSCRIIDAGGCYALPGFIDVHVHGGAGYDFMQEDSNAISEIARFHAQHGTTALLATSISASREQLNGLLHRVSAYQAEPMPYAQVIGVHLEGPFINLKWKGAQNPAHIVPPQPEWLQEWDAQHPGVVKLQTLAPEIEGALPYIQLLHEYGIIAACGHTDATAAQIREAAAAGLRHAVHTYNAMRPLHHREPGTVGAVLTDPRIMAEVIADGHHVHPEAIRLLVQAKGADHVMLVTDAIAAAGMPDGDYELGGLPVAVTGGVARIRDHEGTLAGSTLTMIQAFQYMVRAVGVSVQDASRMASFNPARQLGITGQYGSLAAGKRADLLLLESESLELRAVMAGGLWLYKKNA